MADAMALAANPSLIGHLQALCLVNPWGFLGGSLGDFLGGHPGVREGSLAGVLGDPLGDALSPRKSVERLGTACAKHGLYNHHPEVRKLSGRAGVFRSCKQCCLSFPGG